MDSHSSLDDYSSTNAVPIPSSSSHSKTRLKFLHRGNSQHDAKTNKDKDDSKVKNGTGGEFYEPHRFEGEGISFKGKLIGCEFVTEARGEKMCAAAMKKTKVKIRFTDNAFLHSLITALREIELFDI